MPSLSILIGLDAYMGGVQTRREFVRRDGSHEVTKELTD